MRILVTGGYGFIGSRIVEKLQGMGHDVSVLDNSEDYGVISTIDLENLYKWRQRKWNKVHRTSGDVTNRLNVLSSFRPRPDIVIHLAAESHVDRSIDSPSDFIKTNIIGTFTLLEQSKNYWYLLKDNKKDNFRFLYVSTDEVYGDLTHKTSFFSETSNYKPSSPYSASKASSDHLVRAWFRTYGLPVLITHCSNNYGPCQFPEKLIPHIILNALNGNNIPIYGDGKQIRDWLYVDDHVNALMKVALNAKIGETYNIGGNNEIQNIEVARKVCSILDKLAPNKLNGLNSFSELIMYVEDRPGHDVRYAINANKINKDLGWKPQESFESGIQKTVQWYLNNYSWLENIQNGSYQLERLGVNLK